MEGRSWGALAATTSASIRKHPRANSETSIFNNPSITFGQFPRKMISQSGPKRFNQLQKSLPVYTKRLLCPKALGQATKPKIAPWSEIATGIVRNRRYCKLRPPPGGLLAAESFVFFGPVAPSPWSEIASKPSIPRGTSRKKSKKRRAIASVAPGLPLWPPPNRPSLGPPRPTPQAPKIYTQTPDQPHQRPLC